MHAILFFITLIIKNLLLRHWAEHRYRLGWAQRYAPLLEEPISFGLPLGGSTQCSFSSSLMQNLRVVATVAKARQTWNEDKNECEEKGLSADAYVMFRRWTMNQPVRYL